MILFGSISIHPNISISYSQEEEHTGSSSYAYGGYNSDEQHADRENAKTEIMEIQRQQKEILRELEEINEAQD